MFSSLRHAAMLINQSVEVVELNALTGACEHPPASSTEEAQGSKRQVRFLGDTARASVLGR